MSQGRRRKPMSRFLFWSQWAVWGALALELALVLIGWGWLRFPLAYEAAWSCFIVMVALIGACYIEENRLTRQESNK